MIVCTGNAHVTCFHPGEYEYDMRQHYLNWFAFRCGDCCCQIEEPDEQGLKWFYESYINMVLREKVDGNIGNVQAAKLISKALKESEEKGIAIF